MSLQHFSIKVEVENKVLKPHVSSCLGRMLLFIKVRAGGNARINSEYSYINHIKQPFVFMFFKGLEKQRHKLYFQCLKQLKNYIFFLWRMDWSNVYVSMKRVTCSQQRIIIRPSSPKLYWELSFLDFSFQLLDFPGHLEIQVQWCGW